MAAVVLARDRSADATRTLDALLAQDPPPDALVLVGNDPTPEVAQLLRTVAATHPDGEVVLLDRNLGGAGGFAAGFACVMARSDLDFVCAFDDDATPLPGCLRALRSAALSLASVGAVGAVSHDGSGRLAWPMYVPGAAEPARTVGEVQALASRRRALPVAGLSWHGLMLPVEVLRQHGNVWAELFHQYEDAELGLRLRRAGLHLYLVPDAQTRHPPPPAAREMRVLGRTIRITREAPAKEYLTLRNDLVVRHRYNGARFWYATLPLILLRGFLVSISLGVPRANALRHVFVRAIADAARGRLGPPPEATLALYQPRSGV